MGTSSREGAGTGRGPPPHAGRCSAQGRERLLGLGPLMAPSSHLHVPTVSQFLKLSPPLLPSSGKTQEKLPRMPHDGNLVADRSQGSSGKQACTSIKSRWTSLVYQEMRIKTATRHPGMVTQWRAWESAFSAACFGPRASRMGCRAARCCCSQR